MEIKAEGYCVWYDSEKDTVFFKGFIRLNGEEEYRPMKNLLIDLALQNEKIALDLQELEFLNSSGINMLSMVVLTLRKQGGIHALLKGSAQVLWQTKSLKNLQRLMPTLQIEMI
ncbi:STAS domain-containing protein [Tumidithrix helvetica PCC 7403]|uniref:slr1659 superfamily regulator n=1 Tax=Tumidithrix helvetica TaxID=3457545 RepID=UPI003C984E00